MAECLGPVNWFDTRRMPSPLEGLGDGRNRVPEIRPQDRARVIPDPNRDRLRGGGFSRDDRRQSRETRLRTRSIGTGDGRSCTWPIHAGRHGQRSARVKITSSGHPRLTCSATAVELISLPSRPNQVRPAAIRQPRRVKRYQGRHRYNLEPGDCVISGRLSLIGNALWVLVPAGCLLGWRRQLRSLLLERLTATPTIRCLCRRRVVPQVHSGSAGLDDSRLPVPSPPLPDDTRVPTRQCRSRAGLRPRRHGH